jgi:hypothetical protein
MWRRDTLGGALGLRWVSLGMRALSLRRACDERALGTHGARWVCSKRTQSMPGSSP